MARMKAISISRWSTDGIQINYEPATPTDGKSTVYTEMALPTNKIEFDRLMAVRLYAQFDIDPEKVVITP